MLNQQEVPRHMVQGVQVLQFKNGSYIEVAERVRAVHKAGKVFSFDRGEVLRLCSRWIYRAWITVAGQQYIGDAEIHFGAPPQSPDGTNPITCGQTSAIGNALTFAGFGTLKSILARLGSSPESEPESETDAARRMVEGIEVVLLDEQPYVTVAERIHFVHLLGKAFSIQQCKLIRHNQVWIYRAWITVDEQPYIGDAEVYFDAVQEPDRTYPISCGQTSAVGNALAFAGFGDVRSILERSCKDVPEALEGKPVLASADAISRALQQAHLVLSQDEGTHQEMQAEAPGPHLLTRGERISNTASTQFRQGRITLRQRERIRILCERLGETEPDYATMSETDAEVLLVQLEISEEELLLAVEEAWAEGTSHSAEEVLMSREDVGALKVAWLEAFHVSGTKAVKRGKWEQFKTRTCQRPVDDEAMRSLEYQQLQAAIVAEQERRAAQAPGRKRVGTATANGQAR